MAGKTCPKCKTEMKGDFWCSSCKTVFKCPLPGCEAQITKPGAEDCPRCGLYFPDYIGQRKMYRRCPKCKKKQGLSEQQCRSCRHWFNCPTCGDRISANTLMTCPRCGTGLR